MLNSKRKKRQIGFTLVEVIVVAVIVAALAAVAVPLYLGYVDSSKRNSAANAAGSIASFAGACRNSAGDVNLVGGNAGTADDPLTPENEFVAAVPATSVDCSSNGSTIQVPAGIVIFQVDPVNATAAGTISGCHSTFDCTVVGNRSTYNY